MHRFYAAMLAGFVAVAPTGAWAGYTTIATFNCQVNGCDAVAGLTRKGTSFLWGTTLAGPYDVTPGGIIDPLHFLNGGSEGGKPVAAPTWLVVPPGNANSGGWFYGVAEAGGNPPNGAGPGTIYRVRQNHQFHRMPTKTRRDKNLGAISSCVHSAGPAYGFRNVILSQKCSLSRSDPA